MIVKSQFKAWKWKFQRKHHFFLPFSIDATKDKPLTINSSTGNVLVEAHDNHLTIKRYYHFDGATWAPDFKRVLYSSALHDALLQMSAKYPSKISEEMAHRAFKKQMKEDGFKLWPIYYFAVASFPRRIYKVLTSK